MIRRLLGHGFHIPRIGLLNQQQTGLAEDVLELKSDVSGLKQDVSDLKAGQKRLELLVRKGFGMESDN